MASTTGPLAPTTTKPVTTTETTTAVVEPFCKDAKGNMYISGSTWMENECLECACVGTEVKCAELTKCVKTPTTTSATESTTLPVAPNTTPEVTTRAVTDETTTVKFTESPATTVKSTESPATTEKQTSAAPVHTTSVATEPAVTTSSVVEETTPAENICTELPSETWKEGECDLCKCQDGVKNCAEHCFIECEDGC